jgi:hypothetical protein
MLSCLRMKSIPPVIVAQGPSWSITSHPEFSPPRWCVRPVGARVIWAYSLASAQRRLCEFLVRQARGLVEQSQDCLSLPSSWSESQAQAFYDSVLD